MTDKPRVVILGGGFGGVYTAMYLESLAKRQDDLEVILVNRENYFVYQPMLAEVVGGSVGMLDTVSSLRRLLPHTALYVREIDSIDLEKKEVVLAPQFSHTPLRLSFDHLVVATGNVTSFRGAAGLFEHALPFKNLSDALRIRNHLIDTLETASIEKDPETRRRLLTFVIGGGGFSGTEVAAEINDLIHNLTKTFHSLDPKEMRVVLVHSKDRLMEKELGESLSRYAEQLLRKRGVEIRFGLYLTSATPQEAILSNGERISSHTVISTVPSSPNPLLETSKLPFVKGRIPTDAMMRVNGLENIWAIGDCAAIPMLAGKGICPTTAQFAIREAKVLAYNIAATIRKKPLKEFRFSSLGMLGALGHRSAVAELFGCIKLSGFVAWLMWRAIYWWKLPGFDRKLKVAFSWLLDMMIPIEAVQLKLHPSEGIAQLHFEPGEVIFHQGDIGDFLYIIVQGKVEVIREHPNGKKEIIATLGQGEFFGEMALLNEKTRSATIRCIEPSNMLAVRKGDFGALLANFQELRNQITATHRTRESLLKNPPSKDK